LAICRQEKHLTQNLPDIRDNNVTEQTKSGVTVLVKVWTFLGWPGFKRLQQRGLQPAQMDFLFWLED
jgi:hypothetical protein